MVAKFDGRDTSSTHAVFLFYRWYFIEASWKPPLPSVGALDRDYGLKLWVDLERVANERWPTDQEPEDGPARLLIGRANADGGANSHARMLIDEVLVAYGDRATLARVDRIARGECTHDGVDVV